MEIKAKKGGREKMQQMMIVTPSKEDLRILTERSHCFGVSSKVRNAILNEKASAVRSKFDDYNYPEAVIDIAWEEYLSPQEVLDALGTSYSEPLILV